MELKDFIKTALSDITNAVSELQAELHNGAIVSPSVPNPPKRPDYPVNQSTNDQ